MWSTGSDWHEGRGQTERGERRLGDCFRVPTKLSSLKVEIKYGRDSAENWAPMDDGTGPGGGRDDGGEGRRRESLPRSGGVEVSRVPVNVRTVESQTAIRRQHVLPGSYRVRCWWTMTQGRARAWTGLGSRFGGWRMAVVWSCCLRAHKERKLGAGDRAQFSSQSAVLDIPPPPPTRE